MSLQGCHRSALSFEATLSRCPAVAISGGGRLPKGRARFEDIVPPCVVRGREPPKYVRDPHVKGGRRPAGRARMAARTATQRQRRAENERRRYTKKRLLHLQSLHPELAFDALNRAALRGVSVSLRRAGAGQGPLAAFRQAESPSGSLSKEQPLCVERRAVDARGVP